MRGKKEKTIFLLVVSRQQLILRNLNDVTIGQMLDHEAVRKGCRHLVEMLLLQLLILKESVQEVERFGFPSRLRLLILLNHWSSRGPWLTLILSRRSLSLLNSLFSGCNFFSSRFWGVNSDKFLRVSLDLN